MEGTRQTSILEDCKTNSSNNGTNVVTECSLFPPSVAAPPLRLSLDNTATTVHVARKSSMTGNSDTAVKTEDEEKGSFRDCYPSANLHLYQIRQQQQQLRQHGQVGGPSLLSNGIEKGRPRRPRTAAEVPLTALRDLEDTKEPSQGSSSNGNGPSHHCNLVDRSKLMNTPDELLNPNELAMKRRTALKDAFEQLMLLMGYSDFRHKVAPDRSLLLRQSIAYIERLRREEHDRLFGVPTMNQSHPSAQAVSSSSSSSMIPLHHPNAQMMAVDSSSLSHHRHPPSVLPAPLPPSMMVTSRSVSLNSGGSASGMLGFGFPNSGDHSLPPPPPSLTTMDRDSSIKYEEPYV